MREEGPELIKPKKTVGQELPNNTLDNREIFIAGISPYEQAKEFIQTRSENVVDMARREEVLHSRFWARLSGTHESSVQVNQITKDLLERAGFPRDFFEAVIFDSEYPDAHVQLIAQKIRLSRKFIDLMKGDSQKIASVIAHEIGHVLLSHYSQRETTPDPLNERIQGYEHEYQADRASVILTNRLGIDPSTLAEALLTIEKDLVARQAEDDTYEFNHRSWILSTHPHTSRRISAIRRDSESLPRYERAFRYERIPIPAKTDFQSIDLTPWDTDGLHDTLAEFHPDCVWEEIEAPETVKDTYKRFDPRLKKMRETKEIGLPKFLIQQLEKTQRKISPQVDAVPDDVNKWNDRDIQKMEQWWSQALRTIDSLDGYDDLADEIRAYSLPATKRLLQNVSPEYCTLLKHFPQPEKEDTGDDIVDIDARKD